MRDTRDQAQTVSRCHLLAEWSRKLGVHLLAAGIALSVSLGQPNIAEAGVVMEQPKSRKVLRRSGVLSLLCSQATVLSLELGYSIRYALATTFSCLN